MFTFKQFLKESTSRIPVLDGEREVYIFDIDQHLNPQPFIRTTSKGILRSFDTASPRCIVDYHSALNIILKWIQQEYEEYMPFSENLQTDLLKTKELFSVLKGVHGIWKVWDYSGYPPRNTFSITVGFEVDLDAYNAAKHAAEDLSDF